LVRAIWNDYASSTADDTGTLTATEV